MEEAFLPIVEGSNGRPFSAMGTSVECSRRIADILRMKML